MKTNAQGSKSVRAPKLNTAKAGRAQGGAPEVALGNGTVAVLPNPADAPTPKEATRRKKPEPTIVVREPAPSKAPVAKAPTIERPAAMKPESLRAIGDGWLASLESAGHTKSTVASYRNDLEIAYEHLGADVAAGSVTEKQIAAFEASKGVTKKANGKPKAQPTILKTRRALRLAFSWAAEKKLIAKAPYATK